MIPQQKDDFVRLIVKVAEQYRRPINDSFLETYWHSLQAFSLKEIQAAFITHFENPDNGHFMPHPSDILRILQGSSETQSLQAWTKVLNGIKQVGIYSSIVFDDPLIHAVISDMGNWMALCCKTDEELKFLGYEFQKRYRGYFLKRPQQYVNRLIGILEHQHQLTHQDTPDPVLFGDENSALMTYAGGCDPQNLHARSSATLSQVLKAQNLSIEKLKFNQMGFSIKTAEHLPDPQKQTAKLGEDHA
jgi:hypothetical protein